VSDYLKHQSLKALTIDLIQVNAFNDGSKGNLCFLWVVDEGRYLEVINL
jgi:hypothetical protein